MIPKLDCRRCPSWPGSAFCCLAPAQCSRLSEAAVPHSYLRGQMIFYEGNPPLAVFCVRSGLVKLTRESNHGEAAVVGVRTAGDLLGYRSAVVGLPYCTSAETVEPSVVCAIPHGDFVALTEESGQLALHLLRRLAREFRSGEEQLVERSEEPVVTRTVRFLVRLTESRARGARAGHRVQIPTRREDMALLIGTTPETLSRTLHALAARGLVEVSRKEIRVRDLAGLQKLAE